MTQKDITGEKLVALEISADGCRLRMGFTQPDGDLGTLNFPVECLQSLILTLPQLMEQALRLRYRDESLRLVYPAQTLRIEQASDGTTFIVTMETSDGFSVSFGLGEKQMRDFGDALGKSRSGSVEMPKFN
ncbi:MULTISPECIES: hypothetical protein [Rhodomicrobium]|uniref:hypothetical protein n=1 Tax=Rhodomicrobium TaxID=1068 RepID=UPI000B4BD533|nr:MULTISPECIES: hypothetical protein [Rhodomicrobium]